MCSLNIRFIAICIIILLILINIILVIVIRRKQKAATLSERKVRSYWSFNVLIKVDIAAILIALGLSISPVVFPCGGGSRPVPYPSPTPDSSPKQENTILQILIQLRIDLSVKIENNYYIVQPYPGSNEVVSQKKGTYYRVELKSMIPSEKVLFKGGEYVISGFDPKFSDSINHFNASIIKRLRDGNISFHIYVTGSADQVGSGSRWNLFPGYEYRAVQFHKRIGVNLFSSELDEQDIPNPYTNNHLPNLRAEFIRRTLNNDPYNLESDILEGGITENYSQPLDRNVVFLLYVNWPEDTKNSGSQQ